jgi:hypothetical protein
MHKPKPNTDPQTHKMSRKKIRFHNKKNTFPHQNLLFDKQSEKRKTRFHTKFAAEIKRFRETFSSQITGDHKVITLSPVNRTFERKAVILSRNSKSLRFRASNRKSEFRNEQISKFRPR